MSEQEGKETIINEEALDEIVSKPVRRKVEERLREARKKRPVPDALRKKLQKNLPEKAKDN